MLSNQKTELAADCVLTLNPTSACCAAMGAGGKTPQLFEFIDHSASSRRLRLWELSSGAHCPVIGVCISIDALRRVADKLLVGTKALNDYQLHCEVIAHCKRRSPLAEALQKVLTQRYASALRSTATLKTSHALAAWWHEQSTASHANTDLHNLPSALWATLTHAQCDAMLSDKVLGEVHMIQHQVGVAQRCDQAQLERSTAELSSLKRELQTMQQRLQQQASEHAALTARQQKELMQLGCEVVSGSTLLAAARADLKSLQVSTPQLKSRVELARENDRQKNRIIDLERALTLAKDQALIQAKDGAAALSSMAAQHAESLSEMTARIPSDTSAEADTQRASALFNDRAVLCVGGRPASVPLYRLIVEKTGGRFLHHDGGEQESQTRLDATLAAADLVICQTGCISHGAYWRVKDHCKRHSKPCVFVENPGSASLRRALAEFQPAVLG